MCSAKKSWYFTLFADNFLKLNAIEIEDLINKDRRKLSDITYNYDLDFYNNGTRNQLAKLGPFLEEKTKFKSTIDLSRVKSEIIQIKLEILIIFKKLKLN